MKKRKFNPESLMMSLGHNPSSSFGAIKMPLFLCSTYLFKTAQQGKKFFKWAYGLCKKRASEKLGFIYQRLNHPNLEVVEKRLTIWEKGAKACAVFSSGLAAVTTACYEFLRPGDILLASCPLYGGTHHFLTKILPELGIKVIFFDASQTKESIISMIKKENGKLSMILVETPANPTNCLFDIKLLSEIAKHFSTKTSKVILAVDNTYLGPIYQSPILDGAHLVLYSLTKYPNGHSDVVSGACLGSKKLIERIKTRRTFLGNMSDPLSCWLMTRSLETLKIRMDAHVSNAEKVVEYLNRCSKIENVRFLGNLTEKDGEQYRIFKEQCLSAGAMITFDIKGKERTAFKFLNNLRLIKLAVSLGSTGSLAQAPYTMTHADVDSKTKESLGIKKNTIRLSVGIEDAGDIIADLAQALAKI